MDGIGGDQGEHETVPAVRGRRAERVIITQLLDAIDAAKRTRRLTDTEIADRSQLTRRALTYISKQQVTPRLQTLLRIVDACGLELTLGLRAKRPKPEDS